MTTKARNRWQYRLNGLSEPLKDLHCPSDKSLTHRWSPIA